MAKVLSKKPTVIFDFDGTIANTLGIVAMLYNMHAASFGAAKVDPEEFNELRKMGYKKALKKKQIRWRVLPKLVMLISREMKQYMDEVEPYDGVIDVIHVLQKRGISVGILTSNSADLVQDFLTAHNFPALEFVVSEKTIFGKDKALRRIMKRYGMQPSDVVYVGDEPRDVIACKKAGIRIAGVAWGFGGVEGLSDPPPDALVHDSGELQEKLIDWLL